MASTSLDSKQNHEADVAGADGVDFDEDAVDFEEDEDGIYLEEEDEENVVTLDDDCVVDEVNCVDYDEEDGQDYVDGNEDECTRERVRDQIKGGLKDVLGLGDESIRGQVKDAAKSVLGGVGSSFVNSYLEP